MVITRVRFSCPGMASETSVSVSCASRIAEAEDANGTPLASVVGYWFAGIPLAGVLIFGLGWGLPGMWVGYTCALAIVASLLVARLLRHGRTALVTDPT